MTTIWDIIPGLPPYLSQTIGWTQFVVKFCHMKGTQIKRKYFRLKSAIFSTPALFSLVNIFKTRPKIAVTALFSKKKYGNTRLR